MRELTNAEIVRLKEALAELDADVEAMGAEMDLITVQRCPECYREITEDNYLMTWSEDDETVPTELICSTCYGNRVGDI